jgi:hypothetical protein
VDGERLGFFVGAKTRDKNPMSAFLACGVGAQSEDRT